MIRGDVYEATLELAKGSEGGARPVVIVSRDAINTNSPVVVVVPVSKREIHRRIYPSQVEIRAGDGGLPTACVAMGEQVRAISKEHLGRPIGHLSNSAIVKINAALKIALDLP